MPVISRTVSLNGCNSTPKLACTPYGGLWSRAKRAMTESPKNPQVASVPSGQNGAGVPSGYVPLRIAFRAKLLSDGALAKANNLVVALTEFSLSARPG